MVRTMVQEVPEEVAGETIEDRRSGG